MQLQLSEFHNFAAGGNEFLYLVPSGGIFAIDPMAKQALAHLSGGPQSAQQLLAALVESGASVEQGKQTIEELVAARAVRPEGGWKETVDEPPKHFPLQTLVINLTNQCNLSCQYCYEYGEDKVATPDGKPKFMEWETAQQSVDFLLREAKGRKSAHITFFGGETLMNFPLLKQVVDYADAEGQRAGMALDYSLTTNATLLRPEIVEYLAEKRIGVTVSMDGPPELNDKLRVFANGKGSYDVIAPKVKELLKRHQTRPIAARVTLTRGVTDVIRIFRHLKDEIGFHEVGFAPVTSSPDRLYAIDAPGLDGVLEQFTQLAEEYRDYALANKLHGFSNVSDTLSELHQGVSKSHPCGAGLGLLGVGPSGDISPCHRFVDSDEHKLGHISTGIDREKQTQFLSTGHIGAKYDCHTCWARPVCAGGCYHEAFVRYGNTGHANLHYCDWIRGWTDLCLRIYGEIASRNPGFLAHFDQRKAA
ncbi:MAG: quinohemoprotein amine dehydrogenase maturation protein [Bryobacter sp.]|nr:quinohemoprotein amine dehydrogenase maturation protein [Bryobacter sp.]